MVRRTRFGSLVRRRGVVAAAALLAALLPGLEAFAAKQARVDVDTVDVHQGPGTDTPVVVRLKKGAPLAVSNLPTNGFYKVRTTSGDVGWVQSDSLVIYENPDTSTSILDPAAPLAAPRSSSLLRQTPERRGKPVLRFRAFGGFNLFNQAEFAQITKFDELDSGFHVGGEGHFVLGRKVSMVARVEGILKSTVANDKRNNRTYQWDIFSTPVMMGVAVELSSSRKAEFHVSALGGIALNTRLTTTAFLPDGAEETVHEHIPFTGLFKADAAFHVGGRWKILVEAGYRDLVTKKVTPSKKGGGSDIFEDDDGNQRPLSLDLSGPFVGAGVQFEI